MFHHAGTGQIVDQSGGHTYGAATGATAAVRCREGLVQVDVHDVEAHVAGAATAQQRVEVGSVVVEQTSATVYQLGNLGNLFLEDAQCVGVGHHDTGNRVVEQRFELGHVDGSFGGRGHLDNLQATHGRTGRVGAVGTVGYDDLGTFQVAPFDVVLTHEHQSGQLAVSTGKGVEREFGQTRNLGQCLGQLVVEPQGTLYRLFALPRVQRGEGRHRSHLFVYLGVVLHGAGAQRIEAGLDTEVLVRYVGIVAHYVEFAHFGQFGRSLSPQCLGQVGQRIVAEIGLGQGVAYASRF